MKVKTVSATYERKLNMGDYQSATIGCTVWADIDEGEHPDEAVRACYVLAKESVKEQAAPLFAKQAARVKELFAGLPVELQAAAIEQGGK